MTVDPLEVLRAHNPVPDGSSAPPIERVLSRLENNERQPRRRRPFAHTLVPALAVAAALTVVAIVVVLAATHRRHTPAGETPATSTTPAPQHVPSPGSLMPRGGMRGRLLILGAASASPRVALVYFGQGNAGRGSATSDWLAETSDGGRTWRVARATANLNTFAFAGTDGWAEGLRSDGHGDGGVASWFATHDGARTWHVAASDDPAPGGGSNVSIAGGEVWSLGGRCTRNRCTDAMLKAPASADHLSDTPGQPALGDTTNVSIVATGRDQAYVLADDYRTVHHVSEIVRTRLFATHDGGRTWRRMPAPCPRRTFGRIFGGGTALWATCDPMHGATEMWRSTDGAAHWTVLPSTLGYAWSLEPASAQVAWAVAAGGRVLRTADGGQTWQQVWYGGRPEPAQLAGNTPVLTAQSPTTATVIAVVTRGHVDGHAARTDFVTYRTTDGGRIWSPSVVRLPAG